MKFPHIHIIRNLPWVDVSVIQGPTVRHHMYIYIHTACVQSPNNNGVSTRMIEWIYRKSQSETLGLLTRHKMLQREPPAYSSVYLNPLLCFLFDPELHLEKHTGTHVRRICSCSGMFTSLNNYWALIKHANGPLMVVRMFAVRGWQMMCEVLTKQWEPTWMRDYHNIYFKVL